MSDTYRTLADEARAEYKEEGSRFIAEAVPVDGRDEAESTIDAIRMREHKASHHCSAYRIGVDAETFRYDDDGEPSGTAGAPILREIDGRSLTNTVVVVTRYFGGTELGTGGLARAYGTAAARALDRTRIVERVVRSSVTIRFSYDDTSPAERVLDQFDAQIEESEYTDVTTLTIGVRASEIDAFREAFTNALGGRGEIVGREAGHSEGGESAT